MVRRINDELNDVQNNSRLQGVNWDGGNVGKNGEGDNIGARSEGRMHSVGCTLAQIWKQEPSNTSCPFEMRTQPSG